MSFSRTKEKFSNILEVLVSIAHPTVALHLLLHLSLREAVCEGIAASAMVPPLRGVITGELLDFVFVTNTGCKQGDDAGSANFRKLNEEGLGEVNKDKNLEGKRAHQPWTSSLMRLYHNKMLEKLEDWFKHRDGGAKEAQKARRKIWCSSIMGHSYLQGKVCRAK